MKIIKIILCLIVIITITGCGLEVEEKKMTEYINITAKEAKEKIDSNSEVVILDVRTLEEFNESHIPGAVRVEVDLLENEVEDVIEDKDTVILVYCRTGRRSRIGSQILLEMGYTNVFDFGGIINWPYETE